jgi:ATP-binding cassette subfamily A (ABC1) protein 3
LNAGYGSIRQFSYSGFESLQSIMANTILYYHGLNDTNNINLAFVPMKTPEYANFDSNLREVLALNFPFLIMVIFLIPLYYMVSKLAEEKESKSREGMKMMGLNDLTYYLSWFIFYISIILVMSLIMSLILGIKFFVQSSIPLIFLLSFLYSLSLFGFTLIIVSIIPSQRSSATVATLFHIVSYFMVFLVKG